MQYQNRTDNKYPESMENDVYIPDDIFPQEITEHQEQLNEDNKQNNS